jgi:tetratricopeptide (TPR) repeat protein
MSTERKCRLYNNAAMLLTCVGKYAEAIDSVNKAISISKHKAVEAVFNRSFLYIRIGNLKEAAVTWLTHRDINVEGDEHYYRNQIKRLVTISNRVEDGTKIFCEGKVDFKQLIAMDLFSCNCLLEKCV